VIELILADIEDLQIHKSELIEIMNFSLKENSEEIGGRGGTRVYEKLVHYVNQNMTSVWLALDDQKAVGYAQFFRKDETRVHLNQIAVAEDYQNRGVGSMLIEAVEQSAKNIGADTIELFCKEVNDNAKKFYGKHNYSAEKRLMIKTVIG